jgi:hypothetical protein
MFGKSSVKLMTWRCRCHEYVRLSTNKTRPRRMIQRGRGIDDGFLPRHKLYFRISKEDWDGGQLIEARLPVANQSVNWSKYSMPWDVKFDHPFCGIAQICVRDIPKQLPEQLSDPNDKFHIYAPKHVPIATNYSHSEIQVTKNGILVRDSSKINSKIVKKKYRSIIRSAAVILLEPMA